MLPPGSPLPVRIELFGDEIDSLRSFDPTDQRTTGRIDRIDLLPATEFLVPAGGRRGDPGGPGKAAGRLPERLAADLARFDGWARPRGPIGGRAVTSATPPRSGPGSSAPATGLDHVGPETLIVLDEPADLAEAAQFLWRQADERRAELVLAGDIPKEWPVTYLPPRDWKGRLVGPAASS